MRELSADSFRQHLLRKYSLPARAGTRVEKSANLALTRPLRELWEASDLSATEFADEISDYFGLARLSLPQLLTTTPCLDGFSRRFLRESTIFPFRAPNGGHRLAIADPSDTAAIRAAEIVFGTPFDLAVASYEDITTVLDQRADADDASVEAGVRAQQSDDDIESLRDLASGAPVVRALNDLLERAVELRASDIHIEPFRTGLVVRMRVDGLLRPVAAPSGVLPQAVISRIKIVANLNIAERRLPQDGAARLRVGRADIDIRVAIMPMQHGESAVVRILPKDRNLLVVERLGFSASDEVKLRRLLKLPHGMIVVRYRNACSARPRSSSSTTPTAGC